MREIFSFIPTDGRNTTTGKPNRITGRMSIHGRIVRGASDNNKAITGGRRVMRQFYLGWSVVEFNNMLDLLEEV